MNGVSIKEIRCRFCAKALGIDRAKAGGHVRCCQKNPNLEKIKARAGENSHRRGQTARTKEKLSKIASEMMAKGTWPFSYRDKRIYEYKGVKLHGSWELKYAQFLDRFGIKWERPKVAFSYSFNGLVKKYTPDFYLPDSDEYVEIKGYEVPMDKAKWASFPKPLQILRKPDLVFLGVI